MYRNALQSLEVSQKWTDISQPNLTFLKFVCLLNCLKKSVKALKTFKEIYKYLGYEKRLGKVQCLCCLPTNMVL